MSQPSLSATEIAAILTSHVDEVVADRTRTARTGIVTYNAVCAACGHGLPWERDERKVALIEHQSHVLEAAFTKTGNPAAAEIQVPVAP